MDGVVIIEKGQFETMLHNLQVVSELAQQAISYKNTADAYLSSEDACKYLGYGIAWLMKRKTDIGYYQDGGKISFKRSEIDAYMAKHRIQHKTK